MAHQDDPKDTDRPYYSAEELKEFEEILTEKLQTAKAELESLRSTFKDPKERVNVDQLNLTEFGTEVADKENAEMLMNRQLKFIDSLERAMVRIKNGTYGRCKVTGKLISKDRLRAVPHTETSIEAKLQQNK
jgi:RNA polymerase-binding transcription factor DksA